MEREIMYERLAALIQPNRDRIMEELRKAGPDGVTAGVLAERVNLPHNTLSVHTNKLIAAGLVRQSKRSRFVTYTAVPGAISEAGRFLMGLEAVEQENHVA